MRRQVSFVPEDWKKLEKMAMEMEREGQKTTPGQLGECLGTSLVGD